MRPGHSAAQRLALLVALVAFLGLAGVAAGPADPLAGAADQPSGSDTSSSLADLPPPACSHFKSQATAQEYFLAAGGSPRRPIGDLDPDRDGVACEGLPAPYAGFATLGYNRRHRFLYGAATMPAGVVGEPGYPCLVGDSHFPEAPRRLNVYRLTAAGPRPILGGRGRGAEARPASGRLLWRADRRRLVPGRYYVEFEERVRTSPYGPNECPAFLSAVVSLR